MAQQIRLKRSAVTGKTPLTTDVALGELAINTFDGKMFFKRNNGTESIIELSNVGHTHALGTLTGVVLTSPSTNQVLQFNGTNWVNATIAGSGTVTSVALSGGTTGLTVTGSPITSSGTLTLATTTAAKTSNTTTLATTEFVKRTFATQSTGGTLDWNDGTNTVPGVGPTLLLGNATNGPTPSVGNYFHPLNIEYAGSAGTGNVTQLAISYGSPGNDMWMRGKYNSVWTSWIQFLNSANLSSYATSTNTASKLVTRDASGNFSAGTITATLFSGSGASLTSIPNSATTATSANTASAIVARDGSGNFTAGTITAALSGNASTATTLQTARTINGTSFNGSANITTNSWGTSRTLSFTGDVTGSSAVDGSANVATAMTLANSGVTAGTHTKVTVDAKGRVTTGTTLADTDIPNLDASKITSGVFDQARLPSYVDDVLEYTNLASFPVTGETGKIYVDLTTNKTYRWSGSTYIYITSGAVDSVAGKTGVVTLDKADVGLSNVDNTADASKNVATAATWTTARTISLGGDLSGSASVNGSADVTITAAIGANTVTNADLRDSAALSVIGRSANSSGDPADIAAGTDGHVLRRSGTTLDFGTLASGAFANNTINYSALVNAGAAGLLGATAAGAISNLTASQVASVLTNMYKNGTEVGALRFAIVYDTATATNQQASAIEWQGATTWLSLSPITNNIYYVRPSTAGQTWTLIGISNNGLTFPTPRNYVSTSIIDYRTGVTSTSALTLDAIDNRALATTPNNGRVFIIGIRTA